MIIKLRLYISHLQGYKNRFFFSLTKCESVILAKVYKRKILKISKADEIFRKIIFSNKVNKLGRCHNRLNGRNRQGKLSWQTLILELVVHVIWYCLYRPFVLLPLATLPVSVSLSSMRQRDRKRVAMQCFPGKS